MSFIYPHRLKTHFQYFSFNLAHKFIEMRNYRQTLRLKRKDGLVCTYTNIIYTYIYIYILAVLISLCNSGKFILN